MARSVSNALFSINTVPLQLFYYADVEKKSVTVQQSFPSHTFNPSTIRHDQLADKDPIPISATWKHP